MTILQSLDRYYGRMAARGEAESPGFSREKISFAITLSARGEPLDVVDLRAMSGKKLQPVLREVPAAVKRTAGILPNRFWDKTSYTLGRTAGEGRRSVEEHAAFKAVHRTLLAGAEDDGLKALALFLESWTPERFDAPPFGADMLDANIVFSLDGERRYIHEREAAKALLTAAETGELANEVCLVTGVRAPPRRLHPTIKGVQGAQAAGASLVSFNLDAFTSYGKEQGANAPTSEAAAFRYGAALNRMLDRGSPNRLQRPVGDATVAFWAETSAAEGAEVNEAEAAAAEDAFVFLFDPPAAGAGTPADDNDDVEAARLRSVLEIVTAGRPVEELGLGLKTGTRFHVLGLAPNAARLSVRYWLDDDFDVFAKRLARHHEDVRIEPTPWRRPPSIARLLVKTTALQEKFENIPSLLAGEVMRAVLGGGRYPRTLLAAAIMRLRAGDDGSTGWHAAVIKACLARDARLRRNPTPRTEERDHDETKEPPVSLAKEDPSPAYQLGRLFAALETAQRLALGRVNASIRDRYFGAASATPAGVFPLLLRGAQNHLGKLRKEGKGIWIEREIGEIVDRLPSELPRSLKLEAQGRFAIGYYHQRQAQFAKAPAEAAAAIRDETPDTGSTEGEDE